MEAGGGSDVSEAFEGPGWWEASDGKWYPPEQDLMIAPGWHQGKLGEWLPPTGSEGGAPGWWVSVDGDWYPSDRHPVPCSRAAMPDAGAQFPAPEHVTTSAPGAASDAHTKESPAASSPSQNASGTNCINGHQMHASDNFCPVCGGHRSGVNLEPQVSSPSRDTPFVPIADHSSRNATMSPPTSLPTPIALPSTSPPLLKTSNAGPATIVGAGVLLALGSLLPWASVTTPFGTISKNGTSGDGVLTLICAAAAVVLGIVILRGKKGTRWMIGVSATFLVALVISLIDMFDLPGSGQSPLVSVGIGLWFCVIASVVGLAAVGYVVQERRKAISDQVPLEAAQGLGTPIPSSGSGSDPEVPIRSSPQPGIASDQHPVPAPGSAGVEIPLQTRKKRTRWLYVVAGAVLVLVVAVVGTVVLLGSPGHKTVNFSETDFTGTCANSTLARGTTVAISGSNGAQIAAGSLNQGTDSTATLNDGSSIDTCNFSSSFSVPDNQSSYTFKVGNGNPVTFTHAELVADSWTPGLTHGCPSDLQGGC